MKSSLVRMPPLKLVLCRIQSVGVLLLTQLKMSLFIYVASMPGLWLRGEPHVARFLEVLPTYSSGLYPNDFVGVPLPTAAASTELQTVAAAEAAAAFLPEMSKDDLMIVASSARQGCEGKWLVFVNEGSSLTRLFFVADSGGSGLLKPVRQWAEIRA